MRRSGPHGMQWLAIPAAATLLGWGGAVLAAGGTTDANMATTVVVTSAVTASVTYSSGASLLFNNGSTKSGTTGPCVAGGYCSPSNTATLSIQAPGTTQLALSVYDSDYRGQNAANSIPGSSLGIVPGFGNFADSPVQVSSTSSSPVNLIPGIGSDTPTESFGGSISIPIGEAPTVAAGGWWFGTGIAIPSNTPADTYTNAVTFVVQAS